MKWFRRTKLDQIHADAVEASAEAHAIAKDVEPKLREYEARQKVNRIEKTILAAFDGRTRSQHS